VDRHESLVVECEDHDLEEVAGSIWSEHQPSVWTLVGELVHGQREIDHVPDVLIGDAVLAG
jgi:hypothetical protein